MGTRLGCFSTGSESQWGNVEPQHLAALGVSSLTVLAQAQFPWDLLPPHPHFLGLLILGDARILPPGGHLEDFQASLSPVSHSLKVVFPNYFLRTQS